MPTEPTFSQRMLTLAQQAYETSAANDITAVSTGGTSTSFAEKEKLRNEVIFWERRVALETGRISRVKRIYMGGSK